MRRWPVFTILNSLVLGIVTGLIANSMRSGAVLCVDEQRISTQHQFSANGRYLACLASAKNAIMTSHDLKLMDCQIGKVVGMMGDVPSMNQSWCCGDDGSLLAIKQVFEQVDDTSVENNVRHFVLTRLDLGANEKVVCRWTMVGLDMVPNRHQFAFSSDGKFLAHGRHEKGKVWIEWIDTSTGDVLHQFDVENAFFLMKLLVLPHRPAIVAITHPPGNDRPGHDSNKMSLILLDPTARSVLFRREFESRSIDNGYLTADGEHLVVQCSSIHKEELVDLKSGKTIPWPRNPKEIQKSIDDKVAIPDHRSVWPSEFGSSLLMIHRKTSNEVVYHSYLVDWVHNAIHSVHFKTLEGDLCSMQGWVPGNRAVVWHCYTSKPSHPVVGWFHQLQRWMKWGNPPGRYQHLSIEDISTSERTHWMSLDSWMLVQVVPAPDGKQMLVALSDLGKGMRLELWENPLLPRLLPRGTFTGVVVLVVSFILLRLLASWRKKRLASSRL